MSNSRTVRLLTYNNDKELKIIIIIVMESLLITDLPLQGKPNSTLVCRFEIPSPGMVMRRVLSAVISS